VKENPRWYQDAVIYELRVRSFYDASGDGIGDFRGLTEKLDYLRDLGVDTLWLLPFYPSPLKDDGYDISDYLDVHPDCGTLQDFRQFVKEAHKRRLRVVTELVMNHTSDQHPWFQRARRAPKGSKWRDFYVWSDSPDRYPEARIIFKDFETSNWSWDPVARAYYWHRFYANQPDLNYDSPAVRRAMFQVMDFWLGLGVDGLRIDAVPYLYERDGTNCENLPETHAYLRAVRKHMDGKFRNRMLLGEANQWPEDAVAYFGNGDECHMAFHFPIMPRLFMALHMEDRHPIVDILEQTPAIPESAQWAIFLRNHDELTLEMVTDEERDYMYRVYAHDPQARINLGIRRRLAPLLNNQRRRIELMNALLFSLPGTPVLYYGDEIGMGDNYYLGDRNGVRTPMQWSGDRNAGFSRANPQRLYLPVVVDPEYHYEAVNVEAQQANTHSLLWWMKRMIALRRRHQAFGRGTIEFLHPRNRKVLAFVRRFGDQHVLVVANLSRFAQYVELDLAANAGKMPVEVFGDAPFPAIGSSPYPLTLGPHDFFWFALTPATRLAPAGPGADVPVLQAEGSWDTLLGHDAAEVFEAPLAQYLRGRRWFGSKGRRLQHVVVDDTVKVNLPDGHACLTMITAEYAEGDPEVYVLPIRFVDVAQQAAIERDAPERIIARVAVTTKQGEQHGILVDALGDRAFARALIDAVAHRKKLGAGRGTVVAGRTRAFAGLDGSASALEPTLPKVEQSNTSLRFGDRFLLKLFRRPVDGINPDLEVGRFLTERTKFANSPAVVGHLEYRDGGLPPRTIGVLHAYVPNQGDAWSFTTDQVERYFERAVIRHREGTPPPLPAGTALDLVDQSPPPEVLEMFGGYQETARLLGQRTAELHLALASHADVPEFAPEPFTTLYQRSLYQSMRNLCGSVFRQLEGNLDALPKNAAASAEDVLALQPKVLRAYRTIVDHRIGATRIRTHGDYHLGQVLVSGKDFIIIDFEGEPARPVGERRLKRSPLRDVAGMLRSFEYAAYSVVLTRVTGRIARDDELPALRTWADVWHLWASSAFLKAYLEAADGASFLPRGRDELGRLLTAYLLEKAVYELGYELNHRPDWTWIPMQGITRLLEAPRRG